MNNNGKDSHLIKSTGKYILDGRQAVAYSRIRKVGNGDFERTDRQRTVLKSLIKKRYVYKYMGSAFHIIYHIS